MRIRFIRSSEKKRIEQTLESQFGIKKLNYLLFGVGKDKIRGYTGSLSKEEIMKLSSMSNIELIGLYLIKEEHGLRISFDSLPLFNKQITKNIIEINEEEAKHWLRGNDLKKEIPPGLYAMKMGNLLVGCGRSNGEKILNFVPKDRRLRK